MPKRQKKSKKDDDEEKLPPQRTLADFITIKLPSQHKQQVNTEQEQVVGASNNQIRGITDTKDPENEEIINCKKPTYFICRTKKGGLPIKTESRASGKKVTVIEHIIGDAKSLLQDLKIAFGTGGLIKDDTIELQGDFVVKLTKYFNERKSLFKPYGSTK